MYGNKPIRFEGKPFGKPSKVVDVEIGDLVRVVYLPVTMRHFSRLTGVVTKKDRYGKGFFITEVGKDGKELTSSEGWYEPENVEILVKGYKQVGVSYKPLPNNIKL